jgi:hypothetical protein
MNFKPDPLENTGIYQPKGVINHPNYYKVEKNIHVIKNFTTQEERNYYINIAENVTDEEWNKDPREWWNNKIFFVGKDKLQEKHNVNILNRIDKLFNNENKELGFLGGMASVHRMRPGERMFAHSDNPSGEAVDRGTRGLTNYVIFGMVLYHTNFKGGEIFYDNLNISYKPEAGDLLMHPGSVKYTHSTLPVLPGPNRYISTVFLYENVAKEAHEKGLSCVDEKEDFGKGSFIVDPISAYHQ